MLRRYKFLDELGGHEIEGDGEGLGGNVCWWPPSGGDSMLIPLRLLVELPPPAPEEPPPGAYQIGETVCFRPAAAKGDVCWVASTDVIWWDWPMFWERNGGPDVSIRPLVALPAVELPWRAECASGAGYNLEIGKMDSDAHVPIIIRGVGTVYLNGKNARSGAAALLAAVGGP